MANERVQRRAVSPLQVLREDAVLRGMLDGMLRDMLEGEGALAERVWGPTELTSEIHDVLREVSDRGIDLPQRVDVAAYLEGHLHMVAVVEAATAAAAQRAGPNTRLSLEVYRDPEIDDWHLTLYVRQELRDESLLQMVDEIVEAYTGALGGKSGRLSVTADFRGAR